jgi:peptidoglycan/xylan/chitin deacetylase (PgdA/CDA1 family)
MDKTFVPILAYHEVCHLPQETNHHHPYNVTLSAFKEQMDFLKKNNYSVMRLEELIFYIKEQKEITKNSVVITFDDGYKTNYTNALPILKQYNFPATIFLAADYIGTNEVFPWLNDLCGRDDEVKENWMPLSWTEIIEMSRDGITFGSHTCSHSNIRKMSRKDFEKEIERSKDVIERQINKQINLFSYPFSFPKYRRRYKGLLDETREALLKRGFLGACTTIIGTNSLKNDPFSLKRIQIKNTDNLFSFKAKLEGAYNWAGLAQKIYQKIIEPLKEKRVK